MIQYEMFDSSNNKILIELSSALPNQRSKIVCKGEDGPVKTLQESLSFNFGAFGHRIGDVTSPIDLDVALKTLEKNKQIFNLKILKGSELVSVYDPELPNGSNT